jgi:hypothetical protein
MNDLRSELARVGIRGRLARRIVLELDDHLRCDPAADLGAPREIAERFAAELRVPKTRRSAYGAFAALTFAALAILTSARGGGPVVPGVRGWIESLSGLTVILGGQVSVVAGVLAVWCAVRRPTAPGELRLVQRRTAIALAAGGAALTAHAVQSIAVQPYMSTLWFAFAITGAIVPGLALAGAARGLHGAVELTPAVASSRRPFPWSLVVAVGGAVVGVMVVGSAFAESSWVEGLNRGTIELLAFALGFALLGRSLGIRR